MTSMKVTRNNRWTHTTEKHKVILTIFAYITDQDMIYYSKYFNTVLLMQRRDSKHARHKTPRVTVALNLLAR